jgi:GNAT superfamily N-acetyltransferase
MTRIPGPSSLSPLGLATIGLEELDRVRALWEQLRLAYVEIAPGLPIRGPEESWAWRRASYERHLRAGEGFLLGLEDENDRLVAYAAVSAVEPSPVFAWSNRVAELETLVVEADMRDAGIGARLIDAVREQVLARGYGELQVRVLGINEGAARFYRQLGFTDWILTMHDAGGADGSSVDWDLSRRS